MSTGPVRHPVFADDRWYPSSPEGLSRRLSELMPVAAEPAQVVAVVSPHAGWLYSGAVAGRLYGSVRVPDRVVVVAPNHRGLGERAAIMSDGVWRLPGRDIPLDSAAAVVLREEIPDLVEDRLAHSQEHSLEIQLPFLAQRNPEMRLVPICVFPLGLPACRRIGSGIARAVRRLQGETLLVASSDMNHFDSAVVGRRKDELAIDRMLSMDPAGLLQTVRSEGVSMCGVVPTAIVMMAAMELGATRAELVQYADSGDASGDKSSVVGYAALTFL